MLEGMYSAAAGMAAQQQRMDALAGDVANVNTNGYKQTRVAFRDLLYTRDASGRVSSGAGAGVTAVGRSLAAGPLRETGNPLDVAIDGDGFLQVRRADGSLALTRDGALRLDARGRLGTQRGELVQPPVTVPAGTEPSDVTIAPDGAVSARGRAIGRIRIVTVPAPDSLRPAGDSLFVATAASGAPRATGAGRLLQGQTEASNVDVADAMAGMMEAQRGFQLSSRAIQIQDQLLQIANQVKS
jgi:flagellar basal-body rod protein FlgG